MCFKVFLNNIVKLNEMFQSYEITESLIRNSKVLYMKAYSIIICTTEQKSKAQGQGEAVGLIPVKYSLFGLIEEQITDNNPLFKDFLKNKVGNFLFIKVENKFCIKVFLR